MTKKQQYRAILKRRSGWLKSHYATAALVRFCFDYLHTRKQLNPAAMYALCRLTWITKGRDGYVPATTWRTNVLPAVGEVFGVDTEGAGLPAIVQAVAARSRVPRAKVLRLIAEKNEIGIVNLHGPFRPAVEQWLLRHQDTARRILKAAAKLESPADAVTLAELLTRSPTAVSQKKRRLSPFTFFSPLIACLSPRHQFPIVNRGRLVTELLKRQRVNNRTAKGRFEFLIGFIGKGRCKDGLELDIMGEKALLLWTGAVRRARKQQVVDKALGLRDEKALAQHVQAGRRTYNRLHNRMTNALIRTYGAEIREGTGGRAKYDALIRNYCGRGRSLLIEVKSSVDIASIRLAIGQLYDYRRHLPNAAATDTAILLPKKPDADAYGLLQDLGIHTLWFASRDVDTILQADGRVFAPGLNC